MKTEAYYDYYKEKENKDSKSSPEKTVIYLVDSNNFVPFFNTTGFNTDEIKSFQKLEEKIKNEKAAVQEFQLRKLGGDKLADRILAKEQRIPQVIQWYENRIAGISDIPSRKKLLMSVAILSCSTASTRNTSLALI